MAGDRKPLVLDDSAQLQQIQLGDRLNADATGLVSKSEFEDLQRRFNTLVVFLIGNGIDIPPNLIKE
jgi:hypothetical protein